MTKKTTAKKRATRSAPSVAHKPLTAVDRANRYIERVLNGEVPACHWVKRACERQKSDLQRADFAFHFDTDHANKVARFFEALPHIKGSKFAGQKLHLEDWQCFIVTTVFGWLNEYGKRRFRTVYDEIPRKNGKSTMSAPVGLFCLAADGEPGAEVYSAATTRDQAKIVWGDARLMVRRCPELREALGVETSAHTVYVPDNASVFRPLSRDHQGNLDGLNIHCAIVDEVHGHKDRSVWDVLETGTGAREQPLLWAITTAGFNKTGICYELRIYVTKILDGLIEDDTFFGIIYTIDKDDDYFSEASWRKANPNLGVSVMLDDLERKALKAKQMPSALNNFLTKHLNVWVNAGSPWMNMVAWSACHDKDMQEEDFEGDDCIVAADLATKTDIAAKVRLFVREIDGKDHYYVFPVFYLPMEAIEDSRNAAYEGWEREGYLTATPGSATDFKVIEDGVREDAGRFQLVDAVFDPWQAAHLIQNLSDEGLPASEYRQTVQNMSYPMKELEALVLERRLHHDGNPVLSWMLSNVIAHTDAKDNIYPRKEKAENKIDGAVALIMALGRYIAQHNDEEDFSAFLSSPVIA